ncbi:succinate dehydrogenase assembly factor 2 [Candidatus Mesenet endosymbiont of Agriotes lineatus]|uniref:FAD assembly factor SdhE n=1 Tax=Candidatus Mesenet endosymbiont of Agriotes lineatus TaxID=3077948 RepID=UPI0030CEAF1E
MNDTTSLRKKLLYRSLHRGCKETDILLGKFAAEFIGHFSDYELGEYEKIVDLDDHELYCYITGKQTIPISLNSNIMNSIVKFNSSFFL